MDVVDLAERYVAVWNETSDSARRQAIEQLWVLNGRHFVGLRSFEGYHELEERITGSHNTNVGERGYVFLLGAIRSLHDAVVVEWSMAPASGGEIAASGRDFLLVDEDMRVLADYQFIAT